MKLFIYYITHTLLNSIKKLMKTWVAFIVIIMIFGAMMGFVGSLFSSKDKDRDAEDTTVSTEQNAGEDDEEIEIDIDSSLDEWRFANLMAKHDLKTEQIVDIAISAVFLLLLATNILNAQNSSKIFLPADVPMLFASPLKPQSVLMFRLFCTLGTSLFVSLFMLFQLPNLPSGQQYLWS